MTTKEEDLFSNITALLYPNEWTRLQSRLLNDLPWAYARCFWILSYVTAALRARLEATHENQLQYFLVKLHFDCREHLSMSVIHRE